jgi:cysteinyl-tRNA synthetase
MNKDLVDFIEKTFKDFGEVFGILQNTMQGQEIIKGLIKSIIEVRDILRKEGQYGLADELREKLAESNILVEDKIDGTSTWRIK